MQNNASFRGSGNDNFTLIIGDIFSIFAPNMGCKVLIKKIKKYNIYICKPHFSMHKMGFPGCSLHSLINVKIPALFAEPVSEIEQYTIHFCLQFLVSSA